MISPLARAIRDELLLRVLPYTSDGACTAEAKSIVREILAPTDAEMTEVMQREQAKNVPADDGLEPITTAPAA